MTSENQSEIEKLEAAIRCGAHEYADSFAGNDACSRAITARLETLRGGADTPPTDNDMEAEDECRTEFEQWLVSHIGSNSISPYEMGLRAFRAGKRAALAADDRALRDAVVDLADADTDKAYQDALCRHAITIAQCRKAGA